MRKISWHLFPAENLPETTGTLPLDGTGKVVFSGRTITGKEITLPNTSPVNLYDHFAVKPRSPQRTFLTGDFEAQEGEEIFIGFGADWNWKLFFNGKLLLDATECGNQQFPIAADNHLLLLECIKGKNQLLFELFGTGYRHDGTGGGMDMAFAEYEVPEKLSLRYRPLISFPDAASGAVSVIFTGSRASAAAVDFRKKGESVWQRAYDSSGGQICCHKAVHHIRIEGLEADTEYEYSAILLDHYKLMQETVRDEIKIFRTAADGKKEFSFTFTADLQLVEGRKEFLRGAAGENAPAKADFFAFGGDLMWTTDFDLQVMEQFIEPYLDLTRSRLPLVMVRGNHEIYGKESFRYFEGFSAPYPGKEGYYLFRWGEVCFIVLDFCDDAPAMKAPSTRHLHDFEPYIAAEARWLKNAVRSECCQSAAYRIILAHGTPLGDAEKYMPAHVRKVIDPLFAGSDPEVKIHLYLAGHVHRPFRSIPLSNSCYSVLDPAAFPGAPLPRTGENYSFPVVLTGGPSAKTGKHMQCTSVNIRVTPEKLTVREFDSFHREFDAFSVTPAGEITEIYHSDEFKRYEY